MKQLFIKAFNQLITNKEEIIGNCNFIKQMLTDTSALDREAEELNNEIAIAAELVRQCVMKILTQPWIKLCTTKNIVDF
jgi:hypothetical protein